MFQGVVTGTLALKSGPAVDARCEIVWQFRRDDLEQRIRAYILAKTQVQVPYVIFTADDETADGANPQAFGWIPESEAAGISEKDALTLDRLMGDVSLFDDVEMSLKFLVLSLFGMEREGYFHAEISRDEDIVSVHLAYAEWVQACTTR